MVWKYSYVGPMVRAYKRAFAHLKADPKATIKMDWKCNGLDLPAFRRNFIKALDRRINLKVEGGDKPRGRKDDPDYFWRLMRDARAVRANLTSRLIVRSFETDEARKRFSHLLWTED